MEFYRIAKCKYINDLSGAGARLYGGRWNSKGFPVLYTAGSRALAALELLVHLPQKNIPSDFCSLVLSVPETLKIKTLKIKDLPKDWKSIPLQIACQELGNHWLKVGKYPILKVPSVVVPEENNFLINPSHPDFSKIKIKKTIPFVFDERIGQV